MACTYTYQGKTYQSWELVDKLASMPIEELLKYLPAEAAYKIVWASEGNVKNWYYSQLFRAVNTASDKVFGQAEQVKKWVEANAPKLGVKKDELEWTGILDWLAMKGKEKVSKADVLDYLRGNGVQIEEVVKGASVDAKQILHDLTDQGDYYLGDGVTLVDVGGGIFEMQRRGGYLGSGEMTEAGIAEAVRDMQSDGSEVLTDTTKYGSYTLPGGENYRELLLTLPDNVEQAKAKHRAFLESMKQKYGNDGGGLSYAKMMTKQERDEAARLSRYNEKSSYKSSHWDEANILAHIRMNDRTDADGNRVLFIEEVQSDLGQDKRRGKTDFEGPFIGSTEGWLDLALKRIISYAVDNGYDKVAFVNGAQSADRYDLSKQVDAVRVFNKHDGKYLVAVRRKGAVQGAFEAVGVGHTDSELPDVVGKELAARIIGDYADHTLGLGAFKKDYTGLDLKVGGEGMIAFYDRIVPQRLSKVLPIAGGGKLESVQGLNFDGKNASADDALLAELGVEVEGNKPAGQPGFTITPQMREKVSGGLPLFSKQKNAQSSEIPDTINVDGVDRPTRNSNGKLIHPTEDGVRNFWKWFGNSRVADADGRPLVVYHGTTADIEAFDLKRSGEVGDKFADAAFFTSSQTIASGYAQRLSNDEEHSSLAGAEDALRSKYGKAVLEQFQATGKTAGEISDPIKAEYDAAVEARRARRAAVFNNEVAIYGANIVPVYLRIDQPVEIDADGGFYFSTHQQAFDEAVASGADGVIVRNVIDRANEVQGGASNIFAVFSPTQIKSATGNNGDFDGSNPSIQASVSFNLSDYAEGFKPTTISEWVKAQFTQKRPFMLGFLTLDQIADIYGKAMKSVKKFAGIVQAMDTEKQKISDEADKVVDRWRKLDSKEADKLADVMHAATLAQFDPATFDAEVDSKDSAKVDLRNQFLELSPEAQKLYVDARDSYRNTMLQVRDALAGRIERSGLTGGRIATEIRLEFDKYLSEGPYFPLARFGDFVLISNNPTTGERIVESFESVAQRNKMKAKRIADGFKTKETSSQTYSATKDGAAGKFAGDVLKHIQATEMDEEAKAALMDNLNQLAISSLPDQSYRKHFMHRKGTPGFSKDAMRAFANSQFHAAHHIAKINHADQLSFLIDEINNDAKMATEGDVTEAVQVANELKKRLDDIVNPKTGPVAANLGSLGFLMSLGLNIASGVTNLSQTPLVTYPWLGAKFGFDKAAAAMSKASKDYFGGKWNAQSGYVLRDNPNLTKGEREALDVLQDMGKIDLTQAHDLAGVANQNNAQSRFSMARSRAMKIVGWTFHLPEVFNRQTSALAAYRLAIEGGMNHKQAIAYAAETLDRTHFNYSSSNRARFMQGDFMRVLTMFKQYSQQMTYMLWRNSYQALKGESPEVRREARRLLMGILTMHFVAAGSMGLPLGAFGISTILLPIASAFMGDEDDPWEWEVEYRNMLADTFGTKGGEVIAHGALRALMPWADFAGRVGLGDLWFRPPAREMEGRAELDAWLQTLAGPVYGYLGSWVTGTKLISEGNVMRGVETMMPRAVGAPLKAFRYWDDGVQSMKGDDLGIKLDAVDYIFTAAGFNPTDVSEMYESRNAVKNREHLLDLRRTQLINKWYNARKAGDTEGMMEAKEEISGFNQANSDIKSLQITAGTLARSASAKERNAQNIKVGAYVRNGREKLREEGAFADVEED